MTFRVIRFTNMTFGFAHWNKPFVAIYKRYIKSKTYEILCKLLILKMYKIWNSPSLLLFGWWHWTNDTVLGSSRLIYKSKAVLNMDNSSEYYGYKIQILKYCLLIVLRACIEIIGWDESSFVRVRLWRNMYSGVPFLCFSFENHWLI